MTPASPKSAPPTTRRLVAAELAQHGWRLVALVLLMLAVTALNVFAPLLYRRLIDSAIPSGSLGQIAALTVGMVLAPLVGLALSGWQNYYRAAIGEAVTSRLRQRVFEHVLRAELADVERVPSAEVVYRLTRACGQIGTVYISDKLLPLVSSALLLAGYVAVMLAVCWPLALIAAVAVPLSTLLARWLRRYAYAVDARYGQVLESGQRQAQEVFTGLRTVRAANGADYETGRWRAWLAEHAAVYRRSYVAHYAHLFLSDFVNNLLTGLAFGVGALLVVSGRISLGSLVAFGFYVPGAYAALRVIFQGQVGLGEARAAAEKLDALLALPLERAGGDPLPVAASAPKIEFRDVAFSYGRGDFRVRNLSFVAQPGQLVGIVGATGGGKSTVLDLLLGFYRPQAGAIEVDGRDLRDLSLAALRQVTSLVPQDIFLWDASLSDNLRYPAREAPSAALEAAAQLAQLHDFALSLPDGYATRVGERGQALSGGERQRLALGRAFLQQPRLLLLDEATSALDALTEAQLRAAIERLRPGRTTVVVAHRLSTIMQADLLLVLDHGQLVETGTPAELIALGGVFSQLYRAQQLTT